MQKRRASRRIIKYRYCVGNHNSDGIVGE